MAGHSVCRPHDRLHEKGHRRNQPPPRQAGGHNELHGITPRSIVKQVRDLIDGVYSEKAGKEPRLKSWNCSAPVEDMTEKDIAREIKRLEKLMLEHARNLEFEQAARVRDQLALLKEQAFGAPGTDNVVALVQGGLSDLLNYQLTTGQFITRAMKNGFWYKLTLNTQQKAQQMKVSQYADAGPKKAGDGIPAVFRRAL
jgi:hypothetical protein